VDSPWLLFWGAPGKKKVMKNPNPFKELEELPIAYRYRLWDLGDGITLAAR
jgi:hypothetical protein